MPALTAILISYNEELDLPRALASLAGIADEIILVDSGSTDRTSEIARSCGARVYTRKLENFADQKNYAASLSSNDWILSIDCDQELSPELRSSILAWKQQTPGKNGYEIPLLSNYLGAWIRHSGWYPELRVLLFRRDKGKFVGALHERLHVEGPAGRLDGHLLPLHHSVARRAPGKARCHVHHGGGGNVRAWPQELARRDDFCSAVDDFAAAGVSARRSGRPARLVDRVAVRKLHLPQIPQAGPAARRAKSSPRRSWPSPGEA